MKSAMKERVLCLRLSFTLIEILVALCIFSAVLIPIAGFVGFQMKQTGHQDKRIQAINLAQERLNRLLAKPFQKIPVGLFSDNLILEKSSGETLIDLRPQLIRKTLFHIQLESQYYPLVWGIYDPVEESQDKIDIDSSYLKLLITVRWDESNIFSLAGFKADL